MKIKRMGAAVAVALLAVVTLSACGSEEKPESNQENITDTTEVPAQPELGTIVNEASKAGTFSTLVAAVSAAELDGTLSGEGPFTVFAPTDEAFAKLPAGVLDALLLPENKATLIEILTYHVIAGKILAADVTSGEVATVEGRSVTLATENGVTINGANVVATDVPASNGVIHVIDAVILPPGLDISKLGK
ncbi:MAG: fasciclin domain-containing protein [Candidatus Paceibacterota bacterium]